MDQSTFMSRFVSFLIVLTVAFTDLFAYTAALILLAAFILIGGGRRLGGLVIDRGLLLLFLGLVALGVVIVTINVLRFGDVSPATYWIGGFAVWYLFIEVIRSTREPGVTIHEAYVALALLTGVGNLLYIILFLTGVVNEPIFVRGFQAYFGIDERGFFAYSSSLLPIVGALVPYLCYRAARSTPSRTEWVALALLILTGLASLRSIIWIIVLGSLAFLALRRLGAMRFSMLFAPLAAAFVLGVVLFVDRDIVEGIYELKWAEKVTGDDIRFMQWKFWVNSFLEAPLFGHGLSSAEILSQDIISGEVLHERPGPVISEYGYEILYGKWLSDMGLVFIVYCAIFTFFTFLAPARSNLHWQVAALRFSAICMVIQSATNSYLQTSGFLFPLMLPLVFVRWGEAEVSHSR
jgi:hypothetical protein